MREIKFVGPYTNKYMSFEYLGLPPSVMKIIKLSNSYLPESSDKAVEKDTFKHFVSFMAKNETFLVPLDNQNFKRSVISEELMNHVMHGRQKDIQAYDFSELEG